MERIGPMATTTPEKFEFQAEAKELLTMMIHSVYSNKDIFLRELISNASDAIDKVKFQALTTPNLLPADYEPQIFIETNVDKRTLTLTDNGIGMSKDDLQLLLGTIAKSGTREFRDALNNAKEANSSAAQDLIGQFGVGFYSVFMVADTVTLVTRKAGSDDAFQMISTGDGTYTIEPAQRADSGTTITLQLKPADKEDGMNDYTQEWTIRGIVKKYSDFVHYPVQMDVERTEYERDADGKVVEGKEPQKVVTRETLNSMKAIWMRPESEVTEDEYNEFYKHIAHDWQTPLKRFSLAMEGTFEAKALLYIPGKAPMDLFYRDAQRGIQLYVKRVFIMDNCDELIPEYLRFVKGVVDAEDLSLNISREILQQNRQIQAIRKRLVKKVLATLKEMKEKEADQYFQFWGEFGRAMKEGLYNDYDNQEALLKLALFQSTHDPEKLTSLEDYVTRMKSGQEKIYFMTGDSRKAIENSPHMEAFKAKDYEVLLLSDPIDELWIQSVYQFEEKALQSISKGQADLGTEDEKKQAEEALKEKKETYGSLMAYLQKQLDEDVKEVRLSSRLTESVACLVGNEGDMTPQMEQMLRAMKQEVPKVKRVLELNPGHPLVEKLQHKFSENAADAQLSDYAYLIYNQALLAEGGQLADPGKFSRLMSQILTTAIA